MNLLLPLLDIAMPQQGGMIKNEPLTPPTPITTGSSTMQIALIIVGVVAIVGLTVFFIRKNKKKDEINKEDEDK